MEKELVDKKTEKLLSFNKKAVTFLNKMWIQSMYTVSICWQGYKRQCYDTL